MYRNNNDCENSQTTYIYKRAVIPDWGDSAYFLSTDFYIFFKEILCAIKVAQGISFFAFGADKPCWECYIARYP
ncbi:MAG: hypothetical protein LBM93_03075 [Oscillospiraceae bacterium]|nr:hypothetical protein [Oscillospiraceae bacterium]